MIYQTKSFHNSRICLDKKCYYRLERESTNVWYQRVTWAHHGNAFNAFLSVNRVRIHCSTNRSTLFHLRRRISFNDQTYIHMDVSLSKAVSKKRNNIKHNVNVQLSFLAHKAENVMTHLRQRYILMKYYINKCVIFF